MSKMTRAFLIAGLLFLEVVLLQHVAKIRDSENPDNNTLILLFMGVIFVAIIIGSIFGFSIVPAIGETVGNFFFNPNQQIEKGPHSNALAKVAQGDYEGAIEEYKKNHRGESRRHACPQRNRPPLLRQAAQPRRRRGISGKCPAEGLASRAGGVSRLAPGRYLLEPQA